MWIKNIHFHSNNTSASSNICLGGGADLKIGGGGCGEKFCLAKLLPIIVPAWLSCYLLG